MAAMSRIGVVVVVVATAVQGVDLAAAGPARVDALRLDTSGVCSMRTLEAQAARLLGDNPFDDDASAGITIITRSDGGAVAAEIRIDDGQGHTIGPRVVSAHD